MSSRSRSSTQSTAETLLDVERKLNSVIIPERRVRSNSSKSVLLSAYKSNSSKNMMNHSTSPTTRRFSSSPHSTPISPTNVLTNFLSSPRPISPTAYVGNTRISKDFKLTKYTPENIASRYDGGDEKDLFTIGSGSYSVVKKSIYRAGGFPVALKRIAKRYIFSFKERNDIVREIQIHSSIRHPNIVRLHESFETKEEVILVLDLCDGGNLRESLRNFYFSNKGLVPEIDARSIARGVLQALAFLDSQHILHGDIKPENILFTIPIQDGLNSRNIKICDFGLARKCPSTFSTVLGTRGYVSPELLMSLSYTTKSDIFSLGIVLFEILFGYQPFYPPDMCLTEEVFFDIKYTSMASDLAKNMIKVMLCNESEKRPSALDLLTMEWFI